MSGEIHPDYKCVTFNFFSQNFPGCTQPLPVSVESSDAAWSTVFALAKCSLLQRFTPDLKVGVE